MFHHDASSSTKAERLAVLVARADGEVEALVRREPNCRVVDANHLHRLCARVVKEDQVAGRWRVDDSGNDDRQEVISFPCAENLAVTENLSHLFQARRARLRQRRTCLGNLSCCRCRVGKHFGKASTRSLNRRGRHVNPLGNRDLYRLKSCRNITNSVCRST